MEAFETVIEPSVRFFKSLCGKPLLAFQ